MTLVTFGTAIRMLRVEWPGNLHVQRRRVIPRKGSGSSALWPVQGPKAGMVP